MLGLARLAQSHRNNGIATGWQATVVSLAPYSFLRFKETSGSVAADSSGNNRAGAYVNSPILMGESLVPSDPAGRSITSGLGPRGATILGHAGQTDFTMIFCAKVGDASFGGIPALVNWNGNDAFYWMGQNGRPKLGSTEVIDARSILLTDGKPHIHVIRTKAGKSTLATDVSGGYAAESLYTSAATISVGYNTGTNSGLVGQFGEPAVWDKYLSDDDVLKAILAWRGDEVNPLSVSARYWRVYCTATQKGDGYLNMASIAFRAVREGYCHGAQPEIVTDQSSFVPGKDAHSCLKGDGLGNWQTAYQTTPWWASVDFGRPVQVAEVAMKGINVAGRQPKDFIIQSSPNGIDWVDRAVFTGITGWNTVTERSFQVPAAKTYDMIVLEDAPLAWYKGDEEQSATVMADSSGNGHDATYSTTSALIKRSYPLRPRSLGSLRMTAVSWAATINDAALNVWNSAQWGLEFMVALQGGGSVGQKIVGTNGTISNFGSFSTQWRSGGRLQLTTGGTVRVNSPNAIMNRIMHYFIERNGSVLTLYENGLPVATGTAGGSTGQLFFMGSSSYASSYGFIGYASDFAIYDKAIGPDRIFKHAEAAGVLDPPVKKAWRLYITANNGGLYHQAKEIEFRTTPGGYSIAAFGTAFASSAYTGGFVADKAFDGDKTGTASPDEWASANNTGSVPGYIGYICPTDAQVNEVAFWNRVASSGANTSAPKDFIVQSSTDTTDGTDGTWVDEWSVTDQTGWTAGQLRIFMRP